MHMKNIIILIAVLFSRQLLAQGTPQISCPAGQFVNAQYFNTGQSCGTPPAGTVTSLGAGTWPSFLTPTITNTTTTPTIAVVATAIPNSALANVSITVGGATCTLGSSCSPGGGSFQTQDWTLASGLFATSQAMGNVFYEINAVTLRSVTTRIQGSPTCTTAPTIVILDLGTSASTVYASATILVSQATSTSNGVFTTTGLSAAITAGHYIGIGLSAGACVTPPTISTSVTLQ